MGGRKAGVEGRLREQTHRDVRPGAGTVKELRPGCPTGTITVWTTPYDPSAPKSGSQ
ncbi:hypothetical protein GCM10018793_65170 [Streptomyces sulfonofaciens]|uniref:Uncharacterized protein n=1 Tax=Streptomyces sulfonofaciens TaxID=68272 RepID=A0A919LA12_9ACTN|nr:hypothetical protein GCM10018793_65170 [Streptomyces sulfonofaciens]